MTIIITVKNTLPLKSRFLSFMCLLEKVQRRYPKAANCPLPASDPPVVRHENFHAHQGGRIGFALRIYPQRHGPASAQGVCQNEIKGVDLGQIRSEETRLNSSHVSISYAVFCLKKKTSKTLITIKRLISRSNH